MEINAFTEITRLLRSDEYEFEEIEKLIKKISNNVLEDNDIEQYQVLLYNLIKYEITDIFELFIKYIDIDIQEGEGFTVLMAAIEHCAITHEENNLYIFNNNVVLQLLEYTNDINIKEDSGFTALDYMLLSVTQSIDLNLDRKYINNNVIKIMLEKGADAFANNNKSIEYVIAHHYYDILILILENRGNHKIDICLLYTAIQHRNNSDNSYNIIKLLIQSVDDINELDDNDQTILDYCETLYNSEKLQELLIENGARL